MPSSQSCMPVLVVDSNVAAANELAENLRHSGFEVDVATSVTARSAMRARHYDTVVMASDLKLTLELNCLAELRRMSPRTWIVVISSRPPHDAQQLAFRHGADSLLIAPFAIEELTFRVAAFSHRSRPP